MLSHQTGAHNRPLASTAIMNLEYRAVLLVLAALTTSCERASPDRPNLSRASDEVLVVPLDLHEFAISKACVPVHDFFRRQGVRQPSYVYDILGPKHPLAGALWCQSAGDLPEHYTLLFNFDRTAEGMAHCPDRIPAQRPIGGLSLIAPPDLRLDAFRYADSTAIAGPESARVVGPALQSEYDGVAHIYYSYNGRWMVRQMH
jgi:hypothetical protein